jgi:hypothetical protein
MKIYKTENAGQMLLSTEKIDKALMSPKKFGPHWHADSP